MKRKAKMGRPPIPAAKRREKPVQFLMTAAEREQLDQIASEFNLTISELLRRVVFALPPKQLKEIVIGDFVRTADRVLFRD